MATCAGARMLFPKTRARRSNCVPGPLSRLPQRAWSASHSLTEEQRDAWHADAAKIKSTPRLGQSGSLTAQHDFVGRNSSKSAGAWPCYWSHAAGESRMQNAGRRMQNLPRKLNNGRELRDPPRVLAGHAPDLPRPSPRQPEPVPGKRSADSRARKCLSTSILCDPPRTAPLPPPDPFRGNADGGPGLPSALAALVCPSGRSACPRSVERPALTNSGAAARVSDAPGLTLESPAVGLGVILPRGL